MPSPTLLETVELQTAAAPNAAVIWLHGLGADGHDFVPIVNELDLSGLALRFVFPHAPTMPVTVNGGYVMRAWYDILGTELIRVEDETGLRASMQHLNALIEQEHQRGIPYERIVLAGFSQGCAMTLLTGLRFQHRLAGLIGLSGYLPLLATTPAERHQANVNTPIFLAHGNQDPVIPLARALQSRDALQALGYAVQWHEYPMPHSMCEPELSAIGDFLRQVLGEEISG